MAITVTRKGRKPEEEKFRGTCGRCSTEFTCLRRDGRWVDGDPMDWRDRGHLEVDCPECKTRVSCVPVAWFNTPVQGGWI